jgi:hypothetical protein
MAHESTVIGGVSEMTATIALIANGWQISKPVIPEAYDLVGKHSVTGECKTFQVKTINRRFDRNGEYVISGRKSNGTNYTTGDCDYLVGVDGTDVYITECKGFAEYWASESTIGTRWAKLTGQAASANVS